ncbi:CLC_0170 family protein [Paenibacillus sp. NPDC057967]|uniref:CLC_0170 family protein n=1 Tax=Paenibacillus sp. NPDC057967 TaxID=3346293 RepID=UPI0036D8015F
MMLSVVTIGLSGYLFFICVLCGFFLLFIDAKETHVTKREYRLSNIFGWIHLILGVSILLILWLA